MKDCPDRDCREELLKELSSVHACASKKIPRSWLWYFVVAFAAALICHFATTWYTAHSAEDKVNRLEKIVEKNTEAIKDITILVHQQQIEAVKRTEQMKSIDKKLDEINEKIK